MSNVVCRSCRSFVYVMLNYLKYVCSLVSLTFLGRKFWVLALAMFSLYNKLFHLKRWRKIWSRQKPKGYRFKTHKGQSWAFTTVPVSEALNPRILQGDWTCNLTCRFCVKVTKTSFTCVVTIHVDCEIPAVLLKSADILTCREDLLVAKLLLLEEMLQKSLVAAAHFGLHGNRQGHWSQKLSGQTVHDRWYTTTFNMLVLKS